MHLENLLNEEYFLDQINKIRLNSQLSWVEKNSKLLLLIQKRDRLQARKNKDLVSLFSQVSSKETRIQPLHLN
ncbi:MAG: hypothetical protein MI784_08675 [Cytophagales bacterium]|nr:hypothetical protein [Cytophagales bacterium]